LNHVTVPSVVPPSVSLIGEFWLGLKKIHSLASQGNFKLHILVEDWAKHRLFIEYRFRLDGPESNYTVHLMRLSGNLPDTMSDHRGVMFSTVDRFNQQDSSCGPPSGIADARVEAIFFIPM